MDRRLFLNSIKVSSVGAFLPTSTYLNRSTSATTEPPVPPAVNPKPLSDMGTTNWTGPKIGVVSIGGIGRICLPRRFNPDVKFPNFVRTIAVDTYCTDFHFVDADRKVQLDKDKHLFNRHDEKALARKVLTEVTDTVADLDMVILVAGMGGIIGTTVTPSIAAQMKELGVLTLALVVMPYAEQGARRQRVAETALQALRGKVDALLPVFNDQFDEYRFDWKSVYGYQLPMYLDSIYSSIVNPLCVPGSVNVEFADVRDITLNQIGLCAFGHGLSGGGNAAQQAAVNAIEHSSLGKSRLQQARSALFTLEHGRDVLQGDIKLAIQSIRSHLSPDCHFIYGISALESHREMVQVNILANGIKDADSRLV